MFLGLQNDHKVLMKDIEEGLYKLHSEARESRLQGETMEVDQKPEANVTKVDFTTAFVRVDRVDAGSPAHDAVLWF